jgi:hypothetical protein
MIVVLHSSKKDKQPVMIVDRIEKISYSTILAILSLEQAKRLHYDLEEAIKLLEVKGSNSP